MDLPPPAALLEQIRELPGASALFERLDGSGGVHLVGGAVRDLLIGRSPRELDLVVERDPGPLLQRLGGELRAHGRFGTATVRLGGHTYDVARARRETYAAPGALPDVVPGILKEDLKRRDFTVNATAVELDGPSAGQLRAVPAALADLDGRRLRVLHDQSFIDDPTRLLRLARYRARLGFEVDPQTLTLARAAIDSGALTTISGSRIGAELRLLTHEDDPIAALRGLGELGIDDAIEPGFGLVDVDLAERGMGLLPDGDRQDLLAIEIALRGVPQERRGAVLERLAFEAYDRDAIVAALTRSDAVARALAQADSPSQIEEAVAGAGPELVALAGALGPADAASEWLQHLRHVKLQIDGADLLTAGVPEGPAIGRGLRAALAAKLDGHASGREAELSEALRGAR